MIEPGVDDDLARLREILRETAETSPQPTRDRRSAAAGRLPRAKGRAIPRERRRHTPAEAASVKVLGKLLPLLRRLLKAMPAQREAAIETVALKAFCDWIDEPVILLDEGLSVRYANRAASSLPSGYDVRVEGETLRFATATVAASVREAIVTGSDHPDQPLDIGSLRDSRRLVIRRVAGGADATGLWFLTVRGATIDPLARWRACGLTRAEARIAALVASGRRPQRVAKDLGITVHTVRSHLKAIYAKLDVHTQSQLASMVSGKIDLP